MIRQGSITSDTLSAPAKLVVEYSDDFSITVRWERVEGASLYVVQFKKANAEKQWEDLHKMVFKIQWQRIIKGVFLDESGAENPSAHCLAENAVRGNGVPRRRCVSVLGHWTVF